MSRACQSKVPGLHVDEGAVSSILSVHEVASEQVLWTTATSQVKLEPPAIPPVQSRMPEVPEPEDKGVRRRRRLTQIEPRIQVVEVVTRSTLDHLLKRSQSSEVIPPSARRTKMLETESKTSRLCKETHTIK